MSRHDEPGAGGPSVGGNPARAGGRRSPGGAPVPRRRTPAPPATTAVAAAPRNGRRPAARARPGQAGGRAAPTAVTAAVRALGRLRPADEMDVGQQRRLLADLFRLMGDHLRLGRDAASRGVGPAPAIAPAAAPAIVPAQAQVVAPPPPRPPVPLSPRARQTLERLLKGDSEKQVAQHLRLSRHTVHVYVKTLYRKFGVCSRGELLAKFVDGSGAGFPPPAPPGVRNA